MADNVILGELIRHTNWANGEMVAACAGLSLQQIEHESVGTYGRLDHTLIHLARAQGWYVRLLTDGQPGDEPRLEYDEPFPGIDRILEHLRVTGARLEAVAADASAERTLTFEDDGVVERLPAWVVLLQAAQHATEHRQQIATSLTGLGIEPPEPDLWAYWGAIRPDRD